MRKMRNFDNIAVKNDPKKFWKELYPIIPNNKSHITKIFNNIKEKSYHYIVDTVYNIDPLQRFECITVILSSYLLIIMNKL